VACFRPGRAKDLSAPLYIILDNAPTFLFPPIRRTLPDSVSGSFRFINTNFFHSIDWLEVKPRTSPISLHYNYHSSSFFTSSSALLLSFIHLSSAHTFTNPIRDSLPHKPRSCDILELLNTLFSFPSLKCSLNSGFFLSSLLKYGSNYSYYVLKPLRRPFFPPQS